ncbi:ATP-binding cassette domain-containing protein [Microbacterium sp. 179-B 1A2 NHS]|uniref:ATP-binding cassette domain-containing protein n=1 Tax=Microbacterium sp. 179-B 1A2 NHS TaxID=3142383 RepID=UPI00399FBE04
MPSSAPAPAQLSAAGVVYPNGVRALSDVDLTVRPGEILGVIGESGAGKSTLLGLLTGEVAATTGTVEVLGERVSGLDRSGRRTLRRQIGVVFQGVHLLGNRTVRQNVAVPLRLRPGRRSDRAAHAAAVDEMLRFVGLTERADAYPAQLSGGQRQRVGIARALVTRPRLLVCDEPTSSLDATTTEGVLDLLRDARDRLGTTVVVVTHDLAVVRAVCDRVALFEEGVLRETLTVGPPADGERGSYLERARRELGA